jgi:hypothetical protein
MNSAKLLGYLVLLAVAQHPLGNAQEKKESFAGAQESVTKPIEHPVTEEQLRSYFAVCHVSDISRQLTHEKLEDQRKQLPPWYPQSVWNEIEDAIDKLDMPLVALPVYQRHLSEGDARMLIELFATPKGQQLIRKFLEANVQAQHSGLTPMEAREKATGTVSGEDAAAMDAAAMNVYNKMTPEQRRDAELFPRSPDYKRIQSVLNQIAVEYEQATVNKQMDLAKAITLKHQAEIEEAKQSYEASRKKPD